MLETMKRILTMAGKYRHKVTIGIIISLLHSLQSMISAGSFIGMLAVAFVGGLIGTLVGRLMLKKHFEKAGIV